MSSFMEYVSSTLKSTQVILVTKYLELNLREQGILYIACVDLSVDIRFTSWHTSN